MKKIDRDYELHDLIIERDRYKKQLEIAIKYLKDRTCYFDITDCMCAVEETKKILRKIKRIK